ncbi:MAG TPA: cytochrome-c oxidase, cbb3-type subunit III [Steroidobacteraceae bacterium]|nr:cytochrome-c oxidase, cbb3-type subunit III [Steroidobacteraceae bacterium]
MNEIVAWIVILIVFANIAGCLWLIWFTTRPTNLPAEQTTHVWDGDLTEYNNPLPRWWLWLFLITIVFGLLYLALYPGLGNFAGIKHWSEVSQWQREDTAARAAIAQRFHAYDGKSLASLEREPEAMATARNLFAFNCAPCHGSDARGAKGFPNLTDQDWLWGGTEDQVYQTIANGRDGAMPAWGPVLGTEGVEQVLSYVLSLTGRTPSPAPVAPEVLAAGQSKFATYCVACHGADAHGNTLMGAPNLADSIWLEGGSVKEIRETITRGHSGHMPAHLEKLGETRVRLLAAYVLSLSQPSGAPAQPQTAPVGETAPAGSNHGGR